MFMEKQQRNVVFFWAKIVAFAIGVILACVFQFVGIKLACLVGLAFFAMGFVVEIIDSLFCTIELFATKIESDSAEDSAERISDLKKKKAWAIARIVLSTLMAVFAIVVMVLF